MTARDPVLEAARELETSAHHFAFTFRGEDEGPSNPEYLKICRTRLLAACRKMTEQLEKMG